MANREGQDVWAKRVTRWRDSGLSATEFASEMGLNVHTLRHWGWKLKDKKSERGARPAQAVRARLSSGKRKASTSAPAVPFVEVSAPVSPAISPFEIVLESGTIVRVPGSFDEGALGKLLEVLGVVR